VRCTRALSGDPAVSDPDHPTLAREHVVPLPIYDDAKGQPRVAAQSELYALDETHFLLLCRVGGAGYGTDAAIDLSLNGHGLETASVKR